MILFWKLGLVDQYDQIDQVDHCCLLGLAEGQPQVRVGGWVGVGPLVELRPGLHVPLYFNVSTTG